jgi:predicted LPLAT superfamily acyltransferase
MFNQEPTPEAAVAAEVSELAREKWAQQGIGGKWQHQFFYWVIRYRGKRRAYQFAAVASLWYVLFYPSIRRRTRYYLEKRFPHTGGWFPRLLQSFRLIHAYSRMLVDMGTRMVDSPDAMRISSPDHDAFMALQQHPGGVILLQAHAGCWQVGMSTLNQFERKKISLVLVPEERTLAQFDQNIIEVINPALGLQGVMAMTDTLLQGNLLVMMGDRTFGMTDHNVKVTFLGHEVAFPVTPYRLASSTGARVAICSAPLTDTGEYQLRLHKVFDVPPGLGKKSERYAPYAQLFADCLENFVQEHPWQFYNFYDLWQ